MTERLTRGGSRAGGGYQYQRRDPVQHQQRLKDAGGGLTDPYLDESVKLWTPKQGLNVVRLVPPTWANPQHYGFDLWLHYNVGPEKGIYACLKRMFNKPCPVCEEVSEAEKSTAEADKKYASELKAGKRVMVYIVDRNEEKEGVQAWSMPWTMDRDILAISMDRRTKEVYAIDDPTAGFDVEFERKGTGLNTEYIGIALARRESPLGDPRWLQYAVERPLPGMIRDYDYDHIKQVFHGKGLAPASNPAAQGAVSSRAALPAETQTSARRSVSAPPAEDWGGIHRMNYDQLVELAVAKGLNIDPATAKDDQDLADWICELLHISQAAPPVQHQQPPAGEESAQARLARLRGGG